jgi:hypothetical protein
MDWFETVMARAARIRLHARVALACQCAERGRPVYKALREDADGAAFTDATEYCWRFAVSGERDAGAILSLTQRIEALIENYTEMDYHLLCDVVTVPLRALQAMQDDDKASAVATARALTSALDVADGAEAAILMPGKQLSGDFLAEEERWQAAALDIAEGWRGYASRSMFASISVGTWPQWVSRFLAARQ